MWTEKKNKHVAGIIRRLTAAKEKDDLGEALAHVEEETGYDASFIYDIFTEATIDEEVNPSEAPEGILKQIWEDVIVPAYEFDY